jgi:hypothetical protein
LLHQIDATGIATVITKSSAALKAEFITTFYGINPTTRSVDVVSLTRGQVLTRWREDGTSTSYRIRGGRPPLAEVIRVFGLTNIVRLEASSDTLPGTPRHPAVAHLYELARSFHDAGAP